MWQRTARPVSGLSRISQPPSAVLGVPTISPFSARQSAAPSIRNDAREVPLKVQSGRSSCWLYAGKINKAAGAERQDAEADLFPHHDSLPDLPGRRGLSPQAARTRRNRSANCLSRETPRPAAPPRPPPAATAITRYWRPLTSYIAGTPLELPPISLVQRTFPVSSS